VPVWEACVASASAPTYFPAHALRIEEKGTAQGGDSKTIKLEHQASKLEDDYNEMPIQITAGTGQGQTRTIKNYDGAARVAEVDQPWNIQPDATSEYLIPNLFSLLDGGVGANNPIACAVAEAIRLLGESERQIPMNEIINEIQVLSIGTGDRTTPIALKTAQGSGLLEWGRRLVDVLMDAPSDIHQYVTEQLLDESAQCYLRLQFKIDKTLINQIQAETGYNLSPALDDATPGNLTALNKAADLYIAKRAKTQLAGFLRC
jgi:patatin-like phospholipase/acyl hydrolase